MIALQIVYFRSKAPVFDAEVLKQTLMNFKNMRLMLLVPLTVFNGVEQAFVAGIFTKVGVFSQTFKLLAVKIALAPRAVFLMPWSINEPHSDMAGLMGVSPKI